jgi:hypothetical protein
MTLFASAADIASSLTAWTPFLEPLPSAGRHWWLFIVPLALFLSMAWKAVRLPRMDHYWRDVFAMMFMIIAGVIGVAIGLYILVIVVMPHLPAE